MQEHPTINRIEEVLQDLNEYGKTLVYEYAELLTHDPRACKAITIDQAQRMKNARKKERKAGR